MQSTLRQTNPAEDARLEKQGLQLWYEDLLAFVDRGISDTHISQQEINQALTMLMRVVVRLKSLQ